MQKAMTAVWSIVPVAAFVMVLGSVPAGAAQDPGLTDSERGLTQPVDDTASRPFTSVPASPFENLNHDFDDVPTTHPFHAFVSWLAGRGITGGCGPRLFCPNAPLTRGEMSVFLKTNSVTGSPLAFGFIGATGTKVSGSPNVTSTFDAVNTRYNVTISGHSYFFDQYTTVVTLVLCLGATVTTDSSGGNLLVRIRNAGNTANVACQFQFSTFFNGI